jgi:hypothetical protein
MSVIEKTWYGAEQKNIVEWFKLTIRWLASTVAIASTAD